MSIIFPKVLLLQYYQNETRLSLIALADLKKDEKLHLLLLNCKNQDKKINFPSQRKHCAPPQKKKKEALKCHPCIVTSISYVWQKFVGSNYRILSKIKKNIFTYV